MDGVSASAVKNTAGMVTGVRVFIDHTQLRHVNTLLVSMPEKALGVYERAIRRGLEAGRVQAYREIRERYDIPLASLTQKHSYYTFSHRTRRDSSGVIGYISFAGSKIPLYRFHPSPKERQYTTKYVNGVGGWRITTNVSAADNKGQMLHRRAAFIATMPNGHEGIFKRTGGWTHTKDARGTRTKASKPEIREYFSYSVRDMLDYVPAREAIQERAAEIIRKRIDHELLRALEF